ncbi:amino acid adenylation domain-containing protein [Flavobacterium sp. KACC 22758]|uniref:non-ribosomal peptide synthetase n=1 Tax=Flavobacterium sp. KACC 22758 TaxID=3025667 RepID=UPI002366F2AC|nr:non-ribosomal peptide synthetase [Flavobacterium sp. KACC 22758]WDF58187.1 amino acid adenylation domain-containing protein [Flavobacterium sp. KACC 22758]
MKLLSLKKAKTEEFLNRFLNENQNTDSSTFFEGVHIKSESHINSQIELNLDIKDVTRVQEICNGSDILMYNFYSCVLSVLLHKYEETSIFISPLSQFEDYAENANELFVLKHQFDKTENFKSLFSAGKASLLESIENSFDLEIFKDSFLNFQDFKNKISFGITINDANTNIMDTAKAVFVFDFKSNTPALKIVCKGEMIDNDLLYLFGDNFNKLLNETLQNLYGPIGKIEFRGNKEQQLLSQINLPETDFSLDKNIIELLAEQCENQAEKIAISCKDQNITYKELDQNTNRLARYIQNEFTAGKDDLFGIMLSRSINMVSSILSVWKTGSAYVPVAVNLGDDALQHIIENSNLKAVITDDSSVVEQLKALPIEIAVIDLNAIEAFLNDLSVLPLNVAIGPEDLSYVIYTSGSTGRPKGAMIEHYGMINHILAKITEMNITQESVVAQNAPHTFDISVWQFFAPLAAGGTSVIYDEETILEINEFVNNIAKDKVTLLELVPSYLLEILNYLENENNEITLHLDILILNAETLTKAMVKRWLDAYPQIPIVNTYGATEVSDDMSHFVMQETPQSYSVPVMKQPIQNFEVHILDENKERVPVGVKGEIYLAGPCVGRGYFNDEKRTKEAFLKGPVEGITNQKRIYKTGDLGRFMPNGTMEFIGRNDNQVKILGHRIELDAIENITAEIPAVKSVKAIADTNKQMIVLYYVSDSEIDKNFMEEQLLNKLPKYMLPSAFIHMTGFPLTKNGKIDKTKLPAVKLEDLAAKEYAAPQNETEEKLAVIWQEVLKIDKIGTTDNFFDLGGHSLLAVRAINRIKKELGLNTSVKTFFENPTIAALSKQLKEKKYIPIEKAAVSKSYPLTASQHRFWVLSQVGDASLAYNLSMPLKFKGELDSVKLEESFRFLINRHEALRTSFKLDENGEARQFITSMEELDFNIKYIDLSSNTEKETAIETYLSKENTTAFNLENAPLLRVSLIKSGEDEYVFFMTMHHIIGDGWSSVVLFREMVTIYNSLVQEKEINLPELRIQYKDYAGWLNQEAQQEHYKASEAYWLNQFSGTLPVIELPGFKKRPLVKTYNGDYLSYQFPKSFTEKLAVFSQKHDVTLFMTLMAGINALLSRYTGQQDIIVGSPIAGREHSDLENQIGLYLNTLAFRTQMDKNFNFLDLVRHEKEIILGGYEHQGYPFDELVDKLELKRESGRSVLFDIMVVLQSQSKLNNFESNKLLGLEINEQEINHKKAQFDLIFAFMENDGLLLGIEYNTDIYDAVFIEKIAGHFEQLVSEMIEQPETKIQHIDYLSSQEKQRLLFDFNDAATAYPNDKTIAALFEEQVLKTPNHTAVVFEGKETTYKELNEKANQLGHYLRENYKINPDDFVGIKLGRSDKLIVAILGILKSGGAYAPIDANYPADRIKYIEDDTRCKIIIDAAEWEAFEASKTENTKNNLLSVNSPQDLAYVIYTSGTTGNPKGVMVEQRSVVRLVKPGGYFPLNENKVLLSTGAISFDATIFDFFGTLLNGAKLVMTTQECLLDTNCLKNVIRQEKVNGFFMTTAWFNQLVDNDIEVFETIDHLIFGGEMVSPKHVEKIFNTYKHIKLTHAYGPTENTTFSLTHDIENLNTPTIVIGKPIENSTVYILDESLQPVPVGIAGTLYVAGDGISRGYLNKPELTAEKFIENPFVEGTKMYNTGDLGKWLPNGDVDILGRIDNQVKIRGYRIELGEIENSLVSCSDKIAQVVVDVKEINGNKILIAYYTADITLDKKDLQSDLGKILPDYMLPTYYIQLDVMPLTSNGKVDKKALPEVTEEDLIKTEYIAPRTSQEEVLAAVWSEVLKYENIGVKDSFYNLGGDSIKSILIVSRLKQRGYLLKVDQILRNPVLEDLALLIETSTVAADQSAVEGLSVLTPIQRYFFESETIPDKNHYNQAVVLKSKNELDTKVLSDCLASLVVHHDALRMVYKEEQQKWTQYNADSSNPHYKINFYDLRGHADELESLKNIGNELQSSFDISSGILLHAGHFRLSDGDRLGLIIHHLVVDGVSWRILLEDLSALYHSYQSGTPTNLPLKTDSFQRWSSLQQEFAKSHAMQQERPYWDKISKTKLPQLASDFSNSVKASVLDKRNGFVLDNALTEKLQTQVHHVYKTEINDLLLTGLGLAVQEVFGASQTAVKMEGHGREEIIDGIDIGRTVGWFTSVYPFVLDISGNQPLVSVKDSLRKIPNKGIGYGILNYLDTAFEDSLTPSIQFNYLGDFGSNAGNSTGEAVFEFAPESIGSSVNVSNTKSTILLDVSGMMAAGGLSMSIGYSSERYSEETIEKLTRAYENQLKVLITELSETKQTQLTPSDLTYTNLSFEELKQINQDNNVEDIYELSPLQQGFYYHWLADHSSPMYFEQMVYTINAETLSIENCKQAFDDLISRYSILRTSFTNSFGDQTLQIVHKNVESNFSYQKMEKNDSETIEQYIERIKTEDKAQGFNFEQPSLMRLKIIEVERNKYVFIWSYHHILMDGWCMSILINDFSIILSAVSTNEDAALPVALKYSEYIKWLSKVNKEVSLEYWKKYLNGLENVIDLPFKKKTKSGTNFEIKHFKVNIEGALYQDVMRYCQETGVTLNVFVQGVWGYLLSRYNNTQDSVFGAVVSGRPGELPGVETMVGLFINTIPVRLQYTDEDTPKTLLKRIQTEAIQSASHHYINLSEVQSQSNLGNELIKTLLTFENYFVQEMDDSTKESADTKSFYIDEVAVFEQTNYDFNIIATPSDTALKIDFGYNSEVLDEVFVENLSSHFLKITEEFSKSGSADLNSIDYLSNQEKQELLVDFNDTVFNYNDQKTVVDLFEDQVRKTPENIALRFADIEFTYKELNEKANQFAHYLSENYKVEANDVIGIKLNRSEKLVVSILGVLKSGAAYVPIDPAYPQNRIEYIEKDSNCKIVIDDSSLGLFTEIYEKYSKDNLEVKNLYDNLSYVIYTSGSTGNPKGVMIKHRSLFNYLDWGKRHYLASQLVNTDFGLFTSLSFDLTITSLYLPLITGGSLKVFDPKEDVLDILKEYFNGKLSGIKITPAHISALDGLDIKTSNVEVAVVGGEALTQKQIQILKGLNPSMKIYNEYGPTETTVGCIVYEITSSDEEILIGKPISNTTICILDEFKNLQPKGIAGEIYIGGAGLSKGYLNRADLMADKFIENPYKNGDTLYKSGDIGRWLPDGNIEYFGRIDDQVKIRGHRIELGEIEACLQKYSDEVRQVVIDVKERNDSKILAAYYVSSSELNQSDLRQYLKQNLPEYMVPSFFVPLSEIPLTSNGKTDRKALPDVSGKDVIKNQYAAPRNETEEKLVNIWQEILKIDSVGIHDNFLELGGHSLLIVKVINKIKKELKLDVSIKAFFENPTIETLSKQLQNTQYIPIEKAALQDSYPLTPAQNRFWIVSQFETASLAYNMPAALQLKGELDVLKFEESFIYLLKRHEILRTSFKINEEGELRQFITPTDDLNFGLNYIDFSLNTKIEAAVEEYIAIQNRIAFNLEKAPLVRVSLIKSAQNEYFFFMTMHHIIGDGWSSELLVKEMVTIYNALVDSKEVNLPELRVQYKDYASWLNQESQLEHYKKSEAYWLNQFSGSLPVIELPVSKKRPLVKTYNGDFVNYQFSNSFLEKVTVFSQKHDVTLFMTLMAGVNALLSRYTGQNDFVIGSPIAGREHPDLENQIGLYLNTLALRTKVEKDFNFLDLLRHEKEVILGGYEHQNYPFDELVDNLELKRNNSRSALFDIMVGLQSQAKLNNVENDKLSGLEVYEYKANIKTSQFDLVFTFLEQDNLKLGINYNTDIYDAAFVEKTAIHLEQLLDEMIKKPETKIQLIDYLSQEEKNHLLFDFNDTAIAYPKDKSVVELFEEQAQKTPDNIAVVYNELQLTYKELNTLSNQLAYSLKANYNVNKGDKIGIHLTRSELLVVAILGILKSGSTYIPIDSELPDHRKEFITKDTELILLITESSFKQNLDFYNGNVLLIDTEFNPSEKDLIADKINIEPSDLAYIIYTSGSTGLPKGVMIEHSSLTNYLIWAKECYLKEGLTNTNFGLFTSLSFDLTVTSFFLPLISGGSLNVFESSDTFQNILEQYFTSETACVKLTPAHISVLGNLGLTSSKVQLAIVGGEELQQDHVRILKNLNPDIRIVNEYGPTESTVGCTIYEPESAEGEILIGKPIANTAVYILDEYNNLQPEGVIGEICIGGSGLARGYWNRSELTLEKFIANPFEDGTSLYKTGDIGKWLPDGNLVYLGRVDDQIKIRGHRIELGEIERNLSAIKGVKQSVVVPNVKDGDKFLTAYYTADIVLDKRAIQSDLGKILPDYMLPGYYVQLEIMPLTSNGKIDRKSLPEVKEEDLIKTEYIEPRTAQEKILAAVWSEVLKYENIGINDSFFNLGGDSIKSIQLISKLKQHGYLLKVDQILRNPILEDLALLIEAGTVTTDQSEVEGLSVLTPIQHYFFESETLSDKNYYNQSVVLKSKDELDTKVLSDCITSLITHHDALRMIYKQEAEGWIQYNADSSGIHHKIEFHDLRGESDELLSLKNIGNDLQSSFDISSGILFHVGHFRLSDGDRLALIIHHLVIDGVSWRILLEDLSALYLSKQTGTSLNLPLKTDSFQRWSSLQQDFAKSPKMQQERPYWDNVSRAVLPQLPSDYAAPEKFNSLDKRNGFVLNNQLTDKLQTQVHHVYKTEINDLLLTGLGLAVEEVFGISQTGVKMEGHGREEIIDGVDIGRTIGWFTSVYPFVLDISGDQPLVSVKESLRKIPNKGIGYGILNYLDKAFDAALVPSIQFNYLGDFGSNAGNSTGENVFEFASENIGSSAAVVNTKSDILLDVSGMMVSGSLSMSIGYSSERYSEETIEKLTRAYENQLQNLIESLALKAEETNSGFVKSPYIKTGTEWLYGDLMELSPNQQRFYKYEYACVTMRDKMYNFNKDTFEKDFRNFLLDFPALSLKFETIENKVFQRYIHPNDVALEILIHDISLTEEKQISEITDEFLEKPFDLVNGALIRCLVLQEDASGKNAVVTLRIHHSLLDHYSVNRIYTELCNYFQGEGKQSDYYHPFDFIVEKEKFLSSDKGMKEREYWTDILQETPLYHNEINPNKELVNVIQETVISDDRFKSIKKMAKKNNLPVSAFFIGFYEMILSTVKSDQRLLYSFMVNGREQEVKGMDINKILGVTDNALPISYAKGITSLTMESILEIYIAYLRNRTYQGIPYETIRKDTLQETGFDIDENMSGYLNLYIKEGSVSSKNTVNGKLNVYHDNLLVFYGINLECEVYQDGVYLRLMCPKDLYEKLGNLISLDSFIQDLLKGIKDHENSEINTVY